MNEMPHPQGFVKLEPAKEIVQFSFAAAVMRLPQSTTASDNSSFASPMPMLPPLTNTAEWRELIAGNAVGSLKPEEVLKLFDTRCQSTDRFVLAALEAHLSDCVNRVLHKKLGRSDGGEKVDAARLSIVEAIMNPESARGQLLRKCFDLAVFYAALDAGRAHFRHYKRFVSLDLSDASTDKSKERLATNPIEDAAVRIIDTDNWILRAKDDNRRLACVLEAMGFTQKEIALAVGVTTRQVRRWQNASDTEDHSGPDAV
jgi:hypothetical protein